ncbi:type II CRISPR RNA-guided endonuclease Cas9 [Bacteroides sp. OttesenSCG-928-D19]|nr:type II CRISPR RNA-guided endonuclease Cas9 [Bacteroides sp. OttesenSCG-928-D19]
MKHILGLDLGSNSIGWALIEYDDEIGKGSILDAGSRIIPMDQKELGDFESGNKVSQTAERTTLRSIRRLYERSNLRRERLHRVLNILGFLPVHYANEIDFEQRLGQFKNQSEPKICYVKNSEGRCDFLFKSSFEEMLADFAKTNPQLVGKKIPYDWTIYYLRKKALTERIEKEELAWILLNFNQKRGYYQLRGEEEEERKGKKVEYHALKVISVTDSGDKRGDNVWYNVGLDNGWIYRRQSRVPLDWVGKTKEFIVTTDIDEAGNVKLDKYGDEIRSFRAPSDNDWGLVKIKTEKEISSSEKTVGCYIYDALLENPMQKIKGKLVGVIERKYYKDELKQILTKQKEFHPELNDVALYNACVNELYGRNENHRQSIEGRDFTYLFIDDVIFYQRPLKSKKTTIATCRFEYRCYKDKEGNWQREHLKCISKSHPLYQEFRLWQFIQNLRIYERVGKINGKTVTDIDVTSQFLPTEQDVVALFEWLNEKKNIKQEALLKYKPFGLKKGEVEKYRWGYVEDKEYPCNETRATIAFYLNKIGVKRLGKDEELKLWHILYSINDREELQKALTGFANKAALPEEFSKAFVKFPAFESAYGTYSEKAIKKLLPLMRTGKYWSEADIHEKTRERINKIIDAEVDDTIDERVREKLNGFSSINDFKGLPYWLASYVVYNKHSEAEDILKWNTPGDIDEFLRSFKQHSLRNPIVEKVVLETLRVVRDIWLEYGKGNAGFFNEIHVELGRDMKNTADKRKRMSEQISKNENTNLRIKTMLLEFKESGAVEDVRPYSPIQQEILKIFEEGVLGSGVEIPDDIRKISQLPQPSTTEIQRYRLWLEQKYRSPYTGKVIPLTKLFTTAYQVEHVIPRSRYFDDSLTNKVICEARVNGDKGNLLGYEYIKEKGGSVVDLGNGNSVSLFTLAEYEEFVRKTYSGNNTKMKKLLADEIPDDFVARQLNDSRYISRTVQQLLSALVRKDDEKEAVSTNVISCSGAITSELKQHWGLNDVWNDIIAPRFERLNKITNSTSYGEWTNKDGKRVFQTNVPLAISKGFNKKRIDHRHHAMDAIIVACVTRNHVNYLNNKNARSERERIDLRNLLCHKHKLDASGNYSWQFNKPWDTFTQDVKESLLSMIVTFKQNIRILNNTTNYYQKRELDENGKSKKVIVRQIKGDARAIRKSMHKATVYGKVLVREQKEVTLSVALDNWECIVDKELKQHITELIKAYHIFDKKTLLKYFKDRNNLFKKKSISKVAIYYYTENAASRKKLSEEFGSKKIDSVVNAGVRSILRKHLEQYNEVSGNKLIEHPELAFSPDGIDEMNRNIVSLNNGRPHKPILKVRICEPIGLKFVVGNSGTKDRKYVEADKGTNLFFGIYVDENGKRNYETIPLNMALERQKQGLTSVSEVNEKGMNLLFSLSPNDLVYLPTQDELESGKIDWSDKKRILERVYKMVSCSNGQLFFIPGSVASPIINADELGANNKAERAWTGEMIKETCVKLAIDRIGQIKNT